SAASLAPVSPKPNELSCVVASALLPSALASVLKPLCVGPHAKTQPNASPSPLTSQSFVMTRLASGTVYTAFTTRLGTKALKFGTLGATPCPLYRDTVRA